MKDIRRQLFPVLSLKFEKNSQIDCVAVPLKKFFTTDRFFSHSLFYLSSRFMGNLCFMFRSISIFVYYKCSDNTFLKNPKIAAPAFITTMSL